MNFTLTDPLFNEKPQIVILMLSCGLNVEYMLLTNMTASFKDQRSKHKHKFPLQLQH